MLRKLVSSYSDPTVSMACVCLVGNITPASARNGPPCGSGHSWTSRQVVDNLNEEVGTSKDDTTIGVQRSIAFHELLESNGKPVEYCPDKVEEIASETIPLPSHEDDSSKDTNDYANPKLLSLTRTKWLGESRDGSPDARDSLLQSASESSISEDLHENHSSHKALSTVLALDKEHNLFGLSNTYIQVVGPKTWKRMSKESESKAIFHQTAIIQACYKSCCRRRSKSDLPTSLKCGGPCSCASCRPCGRCRPCASCNSLCRSSSCALPCRVPCGVPCGSPCGLPCGLPCAPPCGTPCPKLYNKPCYPKICSSKPCRPCRPCRPCCRPSCANCCATSCCKDCPRFGLQVSVIRKPIYDPVYNEIEPKSSSILQKPMLARSCHHYPCCIPPSSCFPYLMPCYWPARVSAPCSEPARCFHNPPCPRARTPKSNLHPLELCPLGHTCAGLEKNEKCENYSCIGRNNEALAKALKAYNAGQM